MVEVAQTIVFCRLRLFGVPVKLPIATPNPIHFPTPLAVN
jgi:hypothetical protein